MPDTIQIAIDVLSMGQSGSSKSAPRKVRRVPRAETELPRDVAVSDDAPNGPADFRHSS